MKKTPGNNIILHKCTKNHNHKLYCSWDMICDGCNCYFSFWVIFCLFTPITAQKLKISKKWPPPPKKKPRDVIILHECTKNYNHMLYCSWDMARDGCNCCFSFWAIFCPFTHLTAQKSKFQKMEKTPRDVIILHMCTKNYGYIMYRS